MNKVKSVFSIKLGDSDYTSDVVSFELTSDDAENDSMTFSEYNKGTNRQWTLAVTAAFDGGSSGSLHDYLWNNAGTQAEFIIQPRAGIASPSNPQYTGRFRIPYRPDISMEAGTAAMFDFEFELLGQPTKIKNGEETDVFTDVFNEYF